MTIDDLDAVKRWASDHLSLVQGFCHAVQTASRLVRQGANSGIFRERTTEEWKRLEQAPRYPCESGEPLRCLQEAIAADLSPIRFSSSVASTQSLRLGKSALTAHEAAPMIAQCLASEYAEWIDEWDNGPSHFGREYTENERIGDCRRMAAIASEVTPALLSELRERIDVEHVKARALPRGAVHATEAEKPRRGKQEESGPAETPTLPIDGPTDPDGPCGLREFRYQGRVYPNRPGDPELKPTAWRLVNCLWDAKDQTADFDELAEPVWDDHDGTVTTDRVAAARREANHFFKAHCLPFRITVAAGKTRRVSLRNSGRP